MTLACATRKRAPLVVACAFIVIVALTALRHFPSAIQESADLGAFGGHRAREELVRFIADGSARAVATPGHDAALVRLQERVTRLCADGRCTLTEQSFFARGWKRTAVAMTNLLVRVRGTHPDAKPPYVLLSVHYDGVPMGPGAGDNGAGVACALEIIRALTATPPANDVLVLFCDGEETGLCGARAFALENPAWSEVGAVVNLDARGSDGPVYIFEVGADGPAHAKLLGDLNLPTRTTSLAAEAYQRMPSGTDFTVYLRGGRPGFNLAFIGSPRNYHTAADTIANLDERTMNQMGVSALALVRALSGGAPPMPSAKEFSKTSSARAADDALASRRSAVWFDFCGFFIVRWSAWLSVAAAVGSLAVFLFALRRTRRDGGASLIGTAISCGAVVISIALAVLIGSLVSFALDRWSNVDMPWPAASIWWGQSALLMIGAGVATITSRFVARHRMSRRSSDCVRWDAWFGGWVVLAALAITVASAAPGAVHPLLVPCVVAAAFTILARALRWNSPDWCAAAAGIAALLVWAPIEATFADAFGLSFGGFTALRGALVAIALQPLALQHPDQQLPSRIRSTPAGNGYLANTPVRGKSHAETGG